MWWCGLPYVRPGPPADASDLELMTQFRRAALALVAAAERLADLAVTAVAGVRRAAIRVHDVRPRLGRGGLARLPVFAAAEGRGARCERTGREHPAGQCEHPASYARRPPRRVGALHDPELDVVEAIVLHVWIVPLQRGNITAQRIGPGRYSERASASGEPRSGGWAPVGIIVTSWVAAKRAAIFSPMPATAKS